MALHLTHISLQECFEALSASAVILTRNNRQTTHLENQWSQLRSDKVLADPPFIRPIQAWLHDIYYLGAHPNDASIISATDALCLQADLIHQDKTNIHAHAASLAKPILNGAELLMQWQLSLEDLASYSQDQNTELFLQYAEPLQTLLDEHNRILPQMIPTRLIEKLRHQPTLSDHLPSHIFLYGFVDINPSLEKLFQTLSQYRPIHWVQPSAASVAIKTQAVAYAHRDEELHAMANFAITRHLAQPKEKIICVVPDLTSSHANCLEAFLNAHPKALTFINISSGQPLSQTLLGQSALSFLNIKTYRTPLKEIISCLKSACWVDDSIPRQIEKDRLANQMYALKSPILSLKKWILHIKADNPLARELVEHLTQWLTIKLNKPKGKQTYLTWLNYFFEELNAIQWPLKKSLSSLHYQQYQHLQKVWISFAELDRLLGPCHYNRALQTLNLLCEEQLFAPESKDRPIHILGALEAHGLACDVLWMCHADAHTWPVKSKPNALLPFSFQKEKKMPNACHLNTKKYYDTITQDILASAPEVFVSYAIWHDHLERSPSPCFYNLLFHPIVQTKNYANHDQNYFQKIDDVMGTPLLEKKLPGGSYGLQSQAQCPFQYYARFRLHLSDYTMPSIGFDPLERGIIVHDALAHFYQDIPDSTKLHTLSIDQRNQRIDASITQSLLSYDKNTLIIDTEKKRLKLLLNQWIDFECQRPTFSIQSIESCTQFSIHDLNLTIRIDRIDRLENNSLCVIDYKSSQQASLNGWEDHRLTNPQMPLYVLALGEQCESAALALVKRADPKFLGISKYPTDILGIVTSELQEKIKPWPSLLEQWKMQISQLSFEIKNGYAAVLPEQSCKPCEYCDLFLLCRVHHD
jgi:ATP-dependent helicase/nuclease subunit B